MLRHFILVVLLLVIDSDPVKLIPVAGLEAENLALGQFGPFSTDMPSPRGAVGNSRIYVVRQVVNDQEALIACWRYPVPVRGAPPPKEGGEVVWLKGVATKGWVDDKALTLDGHFKVTGTKQYKTVLGSSRTVFLIEPASAEDRKLLAQPEERKRQELREKLDAIRADRNKPKKPPTDAEIADRERRAREFAEKDARQRKAEEERKAQDRANAAGRKLRLARQYKIESEHAKDEAEAERLKGLARDRLRQIVDDYKDTPAAAEAKKLLDELK